MAPREKLKSTMPRYDAPPACTAALCASRPPYPLSGLHPFQHLSFYFCRVLFRPFCFVSCVKSYAGFILHRGVVVSGSVATGAKAKASVDYARRRKIAPNHTLTHVLNAALNKVPPCLFFSFSCFSFLCFFLCFLFVSCSSFFFVCLFLSSFVSFFLSFLHSFLPSFLPSFFPFSVRVRNRN